MVVFVDRCWTVRKHVHNNEEGYNDILEWSTIHCQTAQVGRLHSFDMELVKNKNEVPQAIIATISDYTFWHRRMGHAHQRVIKHLGKNTEGGPNQITDAPSGACEGCEKGKSKRLPFPASCEDLKKIPKLARGFLKLRCWKLCQKTAG